jgi:hypothetical protein
LAGTQRKIGCTSEYRVALSGRYIRCAQLKVSVSTTGRDPVAAAGRDALNDIYRGALTSVGEAQSLIDRRPETPSRSLGEAVHAFVRPLIAVGVGAPYKVTCRMPRASLNVVVYS